MIGGVGLTELLIVLVIVLIFFGGKRLPELARGLGKSVINFKSGLEDKPDQDSDSTNKTS